MKALFDPKFMFVIILTLALFSCKNNQEGYNDDIETMQANVDTADTTNVYNSLNRKNADESNTDNGVQSSSAGTAIKNTATGSVPGEIHKVDAAYSGADTQNDSISSVNKTSKDGRG